MNNPIKTERDRRGWIAVRENNRKTVGYGKTDAEAIADLIEKETTGVEAELTNVRDEIKTVQKKGWWLAYEMTPLRERESRLRMQLWRFLADRDIDGR